MVGDRTINIRVVTGPAVGSVRNLEQALRSLDTAAIGVQSRLNSVFAQGFGAATPAINNFSRSARQATQTIGGLQVPVLGLASALPRTTTGFQRAGQAAQQSQGQFSGLERTMRRLLVTTGAIAVTFRGLQILFGSLEEFNELQNRLRLVTEGQQELNDVTRELFDISRDTRTAFSATATVYSRTALAAKDLNFENERLLRFTRSINQAAILSGAGEQERRAGLIQLSQGIASNTLRGDELRSVLENIPLVADIIANSLGATRGELRELAREGELTAEVILNAFERFAPQLEQQFGATVPTLGQAVTNLQNAWLELTSAIDGVINVTGGLVSVIGFVERNIVSLTVAVGLLGLAFTPLLGRIALQNSVTALGALNRGLIATTVTTQAFTRALLRNPFTALATGIAILAASYVDLGDDASDAADSVEDAENRMRLAREGPFAATGDESTAQRLAFEAQVAAVDAATAASGFTVTRFEDTVRGSLNRNTDEWDNWANRTTDNIGLVTTAMLDAQNAFSRFNQSLTADGGRNRREFLRSLQADTEEIDPEAAREDFDARQRLRRRSLDQLFEERDVLQQRQFIGTEEDRAEDRLQLARVIDAIANFTPDFQEALDQFREDGLEALGSDERRPGFTTRFGFGNIAESAGEFLLREQENTRTVQEETAREIRDFYANDVFAPLQEGFINFINTTESSLTDSLRNIGIAILENIGSQALARGGGLLANALGGTEIGAGFASFIGIPGAQTGGTFRVRGAPGIDNNLLRVSRDEELTVRNIEQQRQEREQGTGVVVNPVIQIGGDDLRPLIAGEVRATIRNESRHRRRIGR